MEKDDGFASLEFRVEGLEFKRTRIARIKRIGITSHI